MLALSRFKTGIVVLFYKGERIGTIEVLHANNQKARLGFEMVQEVLVVREELLVTGQPPTEFRKKLEGSQAS